MRHHHDTFVTISGKRNIKMCAIAMEPRRRKRQLVLFLTAILLPAVLLIGLTVRVLRQEVELADKRTADDRRTALEQLRSELTSKLEAVKLQELNRLRDSPPPLLTRRTA